MRWRIVALALALAAPTLTLGLLAESEADAQTSPEPIGERAYALVMESNRFNAREWPDTPLLEAYEGERMRFLVHTAAHDQMHTFHLHGHPWKNPDTGNFIDAVRLDAGETHRFNQTAGLGEGHAGDWFYHCHVNTHFASGMWGLLRVYPYAMDVEGDLDELTVTLTDDGEGLEGASFSAHLREGADQVTAATAGEGQPVDLSVEELGGGEYRVTPQLAPTATGELVLTTSHEEGESVARLDLTPTGYELDRDVEPPRSAEDPLEQAGVGLPT